MTDISYSKSRIDNMGHDKQTRAALYLYCFLQVMWKKKFSLILILNCAN